MATTFALGAESNRLPACMSVCLFVTLLQIDSSSLFRFVAMATKFGLLLQKFQIASSFLFFDGIEPFFWPLVLRNPLYKTLFFDFWFRPPNPQHWLPKIYPKIAYNSACMADRPEMFAPNRGFSGWPIEWNHTKCCRADLCCHGNENLANLGYFFTKIASFLFVDGI